MAIFFCDVYNTSLMSTEGNTNYEITVGFVFVSFSSHGCACLFKAFCLGQRWEYLMSLSVSNMK